MESGASATPGSVPMFGGARHREQTVSRAPFPLSATDRANERQSQCNRPARVVSMSKSQRGKRCRTHAYSLPVVAFSRECSRRARAASRSTKQKSARRSSGHRRQHDRNGPRWPFRSGGVATGGSGGSSGASGSTTGRRHRRHWRDRRHGRRDLDASAGRSGSSGAAGATEASTNSIIDAPNADRITDTGAPDASDAEGGTCGPMFCFDVFECWILFPQCGYTACELFACRSDRST